MISTNTALKTPIVIKIGGNFFEHLEDPSNTLFLALAELQKKQEPVILVHGGGEQVLNRFKALGIKSERKNGLRVTPDEHMPIITSVLAGELNKQLVANCTKHGVIGVGITLADGNLAECTEHPDNIGAVGLPKAGKRDLLNALIAINNLPIIASIGKDSKGRLYNVNADHAAICIAQLLQAPLYFFADVKGVLDANKQLIPSLSSNLSEKLIDENVITDGMVVKVQAAQYAAQQINQAVTIASWNDAATILLGNADMPCGTKVLPAQSQQAWR